MKLIRLAKMTGTQNIYRIILVRKPKSGSAVEKLGTFNSQKKKVTLNIFRLLFWLAKKNIFISWTVSDIFFKTLQVTSVSSDKPFKIISVLKKNTLLKIKTDNTTAVVNEKFLIIKKYLHLLKPDSLKRRVNWRVLAYNEMSQKLK